MDTHVVLWRWWCRVRAQETALVLQVENVLTSAAVDSLARQAWEGRVQSQNQAVIGAKVCLGRSSRRRRPFAAITRNAPSSVEGRD